ncbi:MAG: LOG family protein [Enterobacterales bacterium]|nr:LOG family protein [Enterobacterales bacterium]
MIVTVYGGSEPKAGSPAYVEAEALGHSLAENGFSAMTGGYMGTMEGVSKGCAENNGHVIGVTCDEIENWRAVGPNPWVMEERRTETLKARLNVLVEDCDAAMALPGGVGTLTEVMLLWNQLAIDALSNKPLILIGVGWRKVLQESLYSELNQYIPERHRELIHFVATPEAAVELLKKLLKRNQ